MTRRILWLGTGVVLGVSGTVWGRRKAQALAERWRPARAVPNAAALAGRQARRAAGHVRVAVAAGQADARRREDELRQKMRPGA